MKCKKCKSKLFFIEEIKSCDDCVHNGWHDGDDFQYDDPPENEYRDEVEENGECEMGNSFDHGCWIVKCSKCGTTIHCPMINGD